MTDDGTRVNGEGLAAERRNTRLKNWALVLGGVAAVVTGAVSLLNSLGVDQLVALKAKEGSAETKAAYMELKRTVETQKAVIAALVDEVEDLKEDLEDLEDDVRENRRFGFLARMASPPRSLLHSGEGRPSLVDSLLGKGKKSKARKALETAGPLPEFEDIQRQAQTQVQETLP
jgi:hypothetical protein